LVRENPKGECMETMEAKPGSGNPEAGKGLSRRRRTRILVLDQSGLAARLAKQIRDRYRFAVLEEPDPCLVMIKQKESARNTAFFLGEVLVTEARVLLEGATGIGLVQGHDAEKALDLALIDGALQAGLAETQGWLGEFLAAEGEITAQRAAQDREVLASRVEFESMDKD